MRESILVVDDEERIRASVRGILRDEGFEVLLAESGLEAIGKIGEEMPDLVLLDIVMPPGIDGIETLKRTKMDFPQTLVVMISAYGTVETAVKAIKLGAYDFIEKPLSLEKVLVSVNNALSFRRLERENELLRQKIHQRYEVTGRSGVIEKLREEIARIAPTDTCVLVAGERGVGKELVARMIHRQSSRSSQPFVDVNCTAISEDLIEDELFGHEKGAFSGAVARKRGKFELAHGGTLFLDEITNAGLEAQAKILRVLEGGRFARVGGKKTIEADVRVIVAASGGLDEEVAKGHVREDLYYRVNVLCLQVPPLRERREDIPLLVQDFLERFSLESGKEAKKITGEALGALMNYHWPGNVRELKNVVERVVIMSAGEWIGLEDLPGTFRRGGDGGRGDVFGLASLDEARDAFEKKFIERKLEESAYDIAKTAERIGIDEGELRRKAEGFGIRWERNQT